MFNFFKSLGPLRFVLLLSVVILILAAPFVGEKTVMHGWQMMTTVIFPVMVPMYFFVLPLDMTMCGILMQDKPQSVRTNYKRIIWFEVGLLLLLLLAWLPFVYRLIG